MQQGSLDPKVIYLWRFKLEGNFYGALSFYFSINILKPFLRIFDAWEIFSLIFFIVFITFLYIFIIHVIFDNVFAGRL